MENVEFKIENNTLIKYHEQEGKTIVAIPDGVTTIGDSAFAFCENIKEIMIPNSVTIIMPSSFYRCTNLTSITIPNVDRVGKFAFSGCVNLKDITLQNLVTIDLLAIDLKLISLNTAIKNYKNKKQKYSEQYIKEVINFIIENKMSIIKFSLDERILPLDLIHFMLNDMGNLYTSEEIDTLLKLTKEEDVEIKTMLLEYKNKYLGFNQSWLDKLTLDDDEETKGKHGK